MKNLLLVAAAGLAAAAQPAPADVLYSVRTSDRTLVKIDTSNWTFSPVGPLGTGNFDFGDLAFDADGTLYMVTGFAGFNTQFHNLYTVDINTGAATLVGRHGIRDLFGLAFDGNGTLWASQSTTGRGFHRMDKNTGAATFIGDPGVSIDGLTWDSRRDMIVGLEAGPGTLFEINRANGARTLLSAGGGFVNNCGIAYDPVADMIYAIDWSGQLYGFDPNNNYARTTLVAQAPGGAHDGLALFNPAPACYPDCDTSTGVGRLDVFDFLCFQNRYDAGAPYACDCDTSTGRGMCDVFDFLCFQNAYDAGCP